MELYTGLQKRVILKGGEAREALSTPISHIVDSVKVTLERTPPELVTDIVARGIVLTGGGALLQGLDKLLERETGIRVIVADDPLTCVARGAGIVLDNIELLSKIARGLKF